MKIIVCIKQVPNTTEIKIDPITNTLERFHNDNVDLKERAESWFSFLDGGKEFYKEVDDKTMVLGLIL